MIATMIALMLTQTEVYHVQVYGQSNCWGVGGYQPVTFRVCGRRLSEDQSRLEPLEVYQSTNAGRVEMPAYALACELERTLGPEIIVDTYCASNTRIESLMPTGRHFKTTEARVRRIKQLVESEGRVFVSLGMYLSQGEADTRDGTVPGVYKSRLVSLADATLDMLQSLNPVAVPRPLFAIQQASSWTQMGLSSSPIAQAQYEAARDFGDIAMVGPTYDKTYYRAGYNVHLDAHGHAAAGTEAAKTLLGVESPALRGVHPVVQFTWLRFSRDLILSGEVQYPGRGFSCSNREVVRVFVDRHWLLVELSEAPDSDTMCSYAGLGEPGSPVGPVLDQGVGGNVYGADGRALPSFTFAPFVDRN